MSNKADFRAKVTFKVRRSLISLVEYSPHMWSQYLLWLKSYSNREDKNNIPLDLLLLGILKKNSGSIPRKVLWKVWRTDNGQSDPYASLCFAGDTKSYLVELKWKKNFTKISGYVSMPQTQLWPLTFIIPPAKLWPWPVQNTYLFRYFIATAGI